MTYTHNLLDTLIFNGYFDETIYSPPIYYGSLEEADRYLTKKIDGQDWVEYQEKEKALVEATRLIDNLWFQGVKTETDQTLEFPRNDGTTVPKEIRYACYELAFTLIHGVDPNKEIKNQRATMLQYSVTKTMYGNAVQDHVMAGIPSHQAWGYLRPYLVDPGSLNLRRVS